MLEIHDLVVDLDGQRVVDGVSFSVATREVTAVLGPSGSGKTTLLRAVAGLQETSGGRVVLDGRDLDDVAPHQRGLGMMFQDYALFPHLDVAGNVGFGLRMRGDRSPARRARVAEVLELVGLSGFETRAVSSLSGGERQRVALARAIAPAPSVLMLDEPLGALDRALRERLVLDLEELFAALDIGVVYVTHDQGEALSLADQLVVLREGAVVRAGTPREVWAAPRDPWVARFLGFDNVFAAHAVDGHLDTGWMSIATTAATAEVEGPVTILVRPWGVHLDEVGPVAGRVDGHRFAGDTVVIHVRVGEEAHVVVALGADRAMPAPGEPIRLRIDPASVEVLGTGADGAQ